MTDQPGPEAVPPGLPPLWPVSQSAFQPSRRSPSREELRASLPERPVVAEADAAAAKAFPADGELEYERSVIRIPFVLKGREETSAVDVMTFDAYMRLLREPAIRNGLGLRQFEFYIDAWELTNTFSQGLNAHVTFTLSDVIQPKSICYANQRGADFPATIVYNAIYDVYVGAERIIEKQPGTAIATPVRQIPPRNVTVAFEKPFDSDVFAFSAGTCEGMRSITADEFQRGALQARRVRGIA